MSTPGAAAGERLAAGQPADGGAPWQRYICNACGLIYDEAKGDPDSGLPPGTRFAGLPDHWVCPLCAVTKTDFSLVTPPDLSRQRSAAAPASTPGASLRRPVTGKAKAGVVIVGAGRAGWQMAQAIRDTDAHLPVTLVTACAGGGTALTPGSPCPGGRPGAPGHRTRPGRRRAGGRTAAHRA